MALTPEQKAERSRQRKIETAKQYSLGTYSRKVVAPIFQRMIRAEAGALPERWPRVVQGGELTQVLRRIGECACVTCGKVTPWTGGIGRFGGMHCGHFLASRCNSILFVEENVAPQCSSCNVYSYGQPQDFRRWMLAVRGEETVERLERLKNTTRQFRREELVDMRIEFEARLKAAEERMKV